MIDETDADLPWMRTDPEIINYLKRIEAKLDLVLMERPNKPLIVNTDSGVKIEDIK